MTVYLRLLTIILRSNETRFVIQISTTTPTKYTLARTPLSRTLTLTYINQLFKYLRGILQALFSSFPCFFAELCCCHSLIFFYIVFLFVLNFCCFFFTFFHKWASDELNARVQKVMCTFATQNPKSEYFRIVAHCYTQS